MMLKLVDILCSCICSYAMVVILCSNNKNQWQYIFAKSGYVC